MAKQCKSGFKRKKGKCVRRKPLFKGFKDVSFPRRILVIIVAVLFALAIGLIVSGILQFGFMINLRPIWKIVIGVIAVILFVIIFRGVLNIKKK